MQPDGRADGDAPTGAAGGSGDPLIGRLVERRYQIIGRIARGGMASVYEATDIRLDRTVAIKVMHAGLGDDGDFAARFVREARAAARLSHPNVVAVYDQGEDAGVVFLAMELITGHTLRDTISKESPMSPARALSLMEPVLSALASAHRAGLIHRDVKPENVLIADDGRIKVADFGLAKAISADTQHTATQGVLIGTVSYLAPELVVEGRADARADVYAAGVLLYELLTGKKPHEGESPIQVAYKHVHNDVPAPSLLAPDLPDYVDALVARATARDRGLRPADAGVLLHQVHRVSHALANGVREDPELTQDLALFQPGAAHPSDTTPEMWDEDEMEALLSPPPPPPLREGPQEWPGESSETEHTSAYPRRQAAPHRPADRPPPEAARSRRRSPPPVQARTCPARARPGAGHRRRGRRLLARLGALHHHSRRDPDDADRRRAEAGGGWAEGRLRRSRLLRDGAQGSGARVRPRRGPAHPRQRHRDHHHVEGRRALRDATGQGHDRGPGPGRAARSSSSPSTSRSSATPRRSRRASSSAACPRSARSCAPAPRSTW